MSLLLRSEQAWRSDLTTLFILMRFDLIFLLSLLIVSSRLLAQPRIKFTDTKKNFGMVKKGEQVRLTYYFTNTGNQPLLISEGKAGCSCTTLTWPTIPIAPGKQDTIVILFDTSPAYDRQDRTVEVFSNDPASPSKLRFKGVVLRK